MASSAPRKIGVACPQCGATFQVGVELAERPGRCSKCGQIFVLHPMPGIAAPSVRATPAAPASSSSKRTGKPKSRPVSTGTSTTTPKQAPAVTTPQYIPVSCRVCQTLMYGGPDQVGKSLKCPDCGALTEVKAPKPTKRKKQPAALEGEQYELWGVDEAPSVAELVAAQPKYIAVTCQMCQTLMHATEEQVGKPLQCPDCGRVNVVPSPARVKHLDVLATGDDLDLEPAADQDERPAVFVPPRRRMLYEEEREAELNRQAELVARGKGGTRYDARGRPIMPRRPLVTGVWRMLVTQEIIARWIVLSVLFGFAGQFLGESLLTPIQGQAEAVKMIFAVIGFVLALAWLAMAAPLIVAIICESACGEDHLQEPPRLLAFDWFGEVFSVVMAGSVAGLCGMGVWYLVQLVPLGLLVPAGVTAVVVVIVLPLTLLSTLLEGSPLDVVSPRVLRSMATCTGSWLFMYFLSFVLLALVAAAAWLLSQKLGPFSGNSTTLAWAMAPVAIAALLIYSRLLGRLGWMLAESMALSEVDAS